MPLNFASERVTGSFLQLYHYLVYKVCISALRQQLIAVRKQGIKNIPFQKYNLHLINGDVIVVEEDYFLPWEKGLIKKFENASEDTLSQIYSSQSERK